MGAKVCKSLISLFQNSWERWMEVIWKPDTEITKNNASKFVLCFFFFSDLFFIILLLVQNKIWCFLQGTLITGEIKHEKDCYNLIKFLLNWGVTWIIAHYLLALELSHPEMTSWQQCVLLRWSRLILKTIVLDFWYWHFGVLLRT